MAVLLREAIGESLRRARTAQSRTLREVSGSARVSLGYLSEVERGRKEASSELLAAICEALEVPLSEVLGDVSESMAVTEQAVHRPEAQVRTAGARTTDLRGTRVVIPQPATVRLAARAA